MLRARLTTKPSDWQGSVDDCQWSRDALALISGENDLRRVLRVSNSFTLIRWYLKWDTTQWVHQMVKLGWHAMLGTTSRIYSCRISSWNWEPDVQVLSTPLSDFQKYGLSESTKPLLLPRNHHKADSLKLLSSQYRNVRLERWGSRIVWFILIDYMRLIKKVFEFVLISVDD